MKCLINKLKNDEKYNKLLDTLKNGTKNALSTIGFTDSAKALYVYAITKELNKSSAVICSNIFEANKFIQDLKFFCDDIEIIFLPSRKVEYYDIEAESKEDENQRAYAIGKILEPKINIIVTTIEACSVYMKSRNNFNNLKFSIKVEDTINLDEVSKRLIELGYKRADIV